MNSVRNYGDRVLRLQFAEPIHVKYISWSPHQSKISFLIAVPLLTLPLETEGFCFVFSLKALFTSTVNGIFKLCWNVVFMFMWIIFWNSSLHSYWKSKARDPRRFLNSARVQKEHVAVSPHDGMCTPLPSPPPPQSLTTGFHSVSDLPFVSSASSGCHHCSQDYCCHWTGLLYQSASLHLAHYWLSCYKNKFSHLSALLKISINCLQLSR